MSPDGRGPMSLATYEDARPWARAIKEEVMTRRMPKWHAVRGYGDFSNDPSLSRVRDRAHRRVGRRRRAEGHRGGRATAAASAAKPTTADTSPPLGARAT